MAQNRLYSGLEGQVFGRLTVLQRDMTANSKNSKWKCSCTCGKTKTVYGSSLRTGDTQSCGCLVVDRNKELHTVHGHWQDPLRPTWVAMLRRCADPKDGSYADYGGRGIAVCQRWLEFENFKADMGERGTGLTLERKNGNGNYEPSNCVWATRKVQGRNTRRNRIETLNGKTCTLAEHAEDAKLAYDTVHCRLNQLKWSLHDALTRPSRVFHNQ